MANKIVHCGRTHTLALASLDETGHVRIEPFTHETPNTIFVSGTIHIKSDDIGPFWEKHYKI